MKVLLIAYKDNANVGYTLAQCLKSVGVDAVCVSFMSLRLYKEQAKKYKGLSEINKLAKQANIIIFMHSRYTKTGVEDKYNKTKGVLVFHGGSDYRLYYESINKLFRSRDVNISLVQTLDLWGLNGAGTEIWFLPPTDTEKFKPIYKKHFDKKIIAHYPSNNRKGTEVFEQILDKLSKDATTKDLFIYEKGNKVSHEENLMRLQLCDIYLESFHPYSVYKKQSKICGEWGMSALEAAALGKVVVTNFFSHERYEQEYGKHAIQIANSYDEIETQLRKLILMSDEEFLALQKSSRQWVLDQHSYTVVGKRLLDIFNTYFKHIKWEDI